MFGRVFLQIYISSTFSRVVHPFSFGTTAFTCLESNDPKVDSSNHFSIHDLPRFMPRISLATLFYITQQNKKRTSGPHANTWTTKTALSFITYTGKKETEAFSCLRFSLFSCTLSPNLKQLSLSYRPASLRNPNSRTDAGR